MTGSSTFSELLARETKDWIDEEISKGNEAWNARRPIDGLSNIHWDLVIHAASQLNEHLTCSGQNMTPGIFLCRCIQTHYPELLRKSDGTTAQTSDLVHCAPKDLKPWPEDIIRTAAANLKLLCREELGCDAPGTAWRSVLLPPHGQPPGGLPCRVPAENDAGRDAALFSPHPSGRFQSARPAGYRLLYLQAVRQGSGPCRFFPLA